MKANFLPEDKSLVVIGSLNANEADRVTKRSEIRSVQVLDSQFRARTAGFFSQWGEYGISSMAYDPRLPDVVYVATSTRIARVNCADPDATSLEIDNLSDIHEMTAVGNDLWIANTGNDEVVRYDLKAGKTVERIPLQQFSKTGSSPIGEGEEMVDTFHCNQCFEDMEGNLCVLVHHIEGRQILKRIAQKVLKSQGTGGVLELRTGRRIPLNLKAPHTVRVCGDHYVVLNSGHFLLQVYDRHWRLLTRSNTLGFGRGADHDLPGGLYYAGISATRKRYLDIIPGGKGVENLVMVYSLADWKKVHQESVRGIEQINNVYLIPSAMGEKLLLLDKVLPAMAVD